MKIRWKNLCPLNVLQMYHYYIETTFTLVDVLSLKLYCSLVKKDSSALVLVSIMTECKCQCQVFQNMFCLPLSPCTVTFDTTHLLILLFWLLFALLLTSWGDLDILLWGQCWTKLPPLPLPVSVFLLPDVLLVYHHGSSTQWLALYILIWPIDCQYSF